MKKYEYMNTYVDLEFFESDFAEINALGIKGWRIIQVIRRPDFQRHAVIMEREIIE